MSILIRKLFVMLTLMLAFTVIGQTQAYTDYKEESVSLTTSDNVTISTIVYLTDYNKDKKPAIILIHQGGSDKSEWKPFLKELLTEGYILLAYDVRGHGKSDKVESIGQLFNDPNLAPRDLDAVITYLQSRKDVDSKRIGIIGSSIGGNLAVMASERKAIKSAVSISSKTSAVYNLAGKQNLNMKSVFYISSDGDQGGKRAIWAKELYDQTQEPRKISIISNSTKHGVSALMDSEGIIKEIKDWFKDTL